MRTAIISQFYAPEPEPIPHLFARGLVDRGHQVTVVTAVPSYPRGRVFDGYKQRLWQWDSVDGVRILRVPVYPDHSMSVPRRAAYYASVAAGVFALSPVLAGPIDAIWVYHSLSLAAAGCWLGRLRRAPVVFDVQDLYPESLEATTVRVPRPVVKAVGALANAVYRESAAVGVISNGFRDNLIGKGVPPEKIHVIPNWGDEDIYRPVPRDLDLAGRHGFDGRFNVVYGGSFGPAQGLANVVAAARLLADVPDVQFVLIGDGLEGPALREAVRAAGLGNVRFIDRQPEAAMPAYYALADALLVHLMDDPVFGLTVPSKTLSYLASGRPVIAAVGGEVRALIEEAGAGVSATPQSPEDLAAAVRRLRALPEADRARMGEAARRCFLGRFTKTRRLDAYDALLRRVAA